LVKFEEPYPVNLVQVPVHIPAKHYTVDELIEVVKEGAERKILEEINRNFDMGAYFRKRKELEEFAEKVKKEVGL
jgi:hypothetical protein